jgi:hypothetical protein
MRRGPELYRQIHLDLITSVVRTEPKVGKTHHGSWRSTCCWVVATRPANQLLADQALTLISANNALKTLPISAKRSSKASLSSGSSCLPAAWIDAIYPISTRSSSGLSSAYNTHQAIRHPAIASRPVGVSPILIDVSVDVIFLVLVYVQNKI